jgi:hypothetical protein
MMHDDMVKLTDKLTAIQTAKRINYTVCRNNIRQIVKFMSDIMDDPGEYNQWQLRLEHGKEGNSQQWK